MYFPVGWPKAVNLSLPKESTGINHICCDAVKILVAAIGDNFLGVWYANPLIPITFFCRTSESVKTFGTNKLIIWKPDSRKLAILTSIGSLLLYQVDFDVDANGVLTQVDPPTANLKRDSAELFIKENIPRLNIKEICCITMSSTISTICCISLTELIIATEDCELIKTQWDDLKENNGNHIVINLRNIPFYMNQNSNLKSLPPIGENHYVSAMEYSPFIGGCAVVFNDNRAAYLIAMQLRFEEQKMHGFWVPDIDDATICSVNHKFRLLAYGRKNSDVAVYAIEDTTGGLETSHKLSLNSRVMPATLGEVNEIKWSPDGCVIAVSWNNGGISVWSTFGTLLMSSLSWEFGINVDLIHHNPLMVSKMEWSTEGYQLFITCNIQNSAEQPSKVLTSNVLLLNFVKSTLTMNPCMASNSHVLLQGDDTLYLNLGDNLETIYSGSKFTFPNNDTEFIEEKNGDDDNMEIQKKVDISSILSESKYWNILQLPLTYAATNWPIRYSAIDADGLHLAVAGRTGLAHYSMLTKKWKLFGNESQEKDFVVSGGLLWWKGFIVMGCYSLLDRIDEIRCYPEECKLDNQFGNKIQVRAPVISLNMFKDQLIVLTADGLVSMFILKKRDAYSLSVECVYEVDVKSICIHPACIVSLTVTNLKNDLTMKSVQSPESSTAETIIVNVCGRILMIQRDLRNNVINSLMASCLASCVECFWLSNAYEKSPMRDCLWLYSGAHGMRVWLPILPPIHEEVRDAPHRLHTFMSKRIMLSFPLKLYPLVILFDNVIVLGVENETTLYTNEQESHFSLPFSLLERKSQVYLHKILRQLIKRNLGYSAWEIAKSCRSLPYFPHSLELLLHEVLEEEATSKDPIPDALLPSILDFIREFPVYMQTIVQCARKTEIALWPYLFSMAGKPKDLFQQCLQSEELETAASYLIILQNLEPSVVSKQYATLLLDIALENRKWELAKDLIRFLKAIDPNEIDSPRSSMIVNVKIAPPSQAQTQVNQNAEVFNLILGPIARERSFSTTVINNVQKDRKEKTPAIAATTSIATTSAVISNEAASTPGNNNSHPVMRRKSERCNSIKEKKEAFFIESILQRHARNLLQKCKLLDLGFLSAFLDFHLVTWLSQEKERTAKLDDFVETLTTIHEELNLPPPLRRPSSAEPSLSFETDLGNFRNGLLSNDGRTHIMNTSSQTSESGYLSLAMMDTPTSTNNGNSGYYQIPAIQEHQELQYSSLPVQSNAPNTDFTKSRSNSQISFDNTRYRRLSSVHDDVSTFTLGLNCIENPEYTQVKLLPEKLAVKIRYLLQLFIEANCIDYALVLSILLQDAASIGRIINVVIRSETLTTCNRIEAALLNITHWSFDKNCVYRAFMILMQPHLYNLTKFIQSTANSMGNSYPYRKLDTLVIGETAEPDDISEGVLKASHQNTTNPNVNWIAEKYPNDSKRILRQASIESTGKHVSEASLSLTKKRNSSEDIKRNEAGGCRIM